MTSSGGRRNDDDDDDDDDDNVDVDADAEALKVRISVSNRASSQTNVSAEIDEKSQAIVCSLCKCLLRGRAGRRAGGCASVSL